MKKYFTTGLLAAALMIVAVSANASGILIPKERNLPPLAIKSHRVSCEIKDQVAETHVTQVFTNSTNRDLEATFIFPLPAGASVSEFTLYINGKPTQAELLEKDEAAKIYQSIVSRMRDPGLLEYMGNNLFKARVYPVPANGDQKIELKYNEVIPFTGSMAEYIYPLQTGEYASRTLEDFTLTVHIESKIPLLSVYSPTHKIEIDRKSSKEAEIGFEKGQFALNQDFRLLYTVSEKDIGLNVLTYREKGKDGFFLLSLSPSPEKESNKYIPRDIAFVIDTSGSMREDDKIEQAKRALMYSLRSLRPEDRFSLVRFSTGVEEFEPELIKASPESVERACEFIDGLRAQGGTDINSALSKVLGYPKYDKRPFYVIFLTDGLPTVGETDQGTIESNFSDRNINKARLFSFGVGSNVNTHLLDGLSENNGGITTYVKPKEEMEIKLSQFQQKIDYPVLTDAEIKIGSNIKTFDMFPPKIGDLFAGEQVIIYGRYRGEGPSAIELSGNLGDKPYQSIYETTFPEKSTDSKFIPRLWATRQIGYLLDQIRLHGETAELKNEVIELSKTYNILTPYTSYLAVEDKEIVAHNAPQPLSSMYMRRPQEDFRHNYPKPTAREKSQGFILRDESVKAPLFSPRRYEISTGQEAVDYAKGVQDYKLAEKEMSEENNLKYIDGIGYYLTNEGYWVSEKFDNTKEIIKIKYGSPAYFELLSKYPEIKSVLLLGDKVKFEFKGKYYEIGENGIVQFKEGELK